MPLIYAKLRAFKRKSTAYKVSDAEGLFLLAALGEPKLWCFAQFFAGIADALAG